MDAYAPSLLGAAPILAGAAAVWAVRRLRRQCRQWGEATRHEAVQCCTLANHKGGVGKTTVTLLLAKQLAEDHSQNVLVVDCSLYGDISRLLLGSRAAQVGSKDSDHIEGLADRITKSSLCGWCCKGQPKIEQFVRPVDGCGGNFFVLTSRAQSVNSATGTEECMQGMGAPLAAKGLRDMLARDHAANGKPWIVVADTDGGLTHGMTRLALCLADTITVPVNADVADIKRLRILLNLMAKLHREGQCIAEISGAFFNKLPVKNNEPSSEATDIGLGFCTQHANMAQVVAVQAEFEALRGEFPRLLSALAPDAKPRKDGGDAKADNPKARFFHAMRAGGTSLEKLKRNPKDTFVNKNFAQDVAQLTDNIQPGLTRKKLF